MWRSKHERKKEPSPIWGWIATLVSGTLAAVVCWVILVMAMVM